MDSKYKILNLIGDLGTPSFYENLGNILLKLFESSKIIIARKWDDSWVILDAKNFNLKEMEFENLQKLEANFNLGEVKKIDLSNETVVYHDGKEKSELKEFLNKAFEKEKELFEKQRLMNVVDRLSYQLSAIESLVLNLSEPLSESKFIEIIQSSISELLFCSAYTYRKNDNMGELYSRIGHLDFEYKNFRFNEAIYSTLEMSIPLVLKNTQDLNKMKKNKAKCIIPVGDLSHQSFLIFIIRDTEIEEEEELFINTITRIIQHFYQKQFLENIDFKQKMSLKTMKFLQIYDDLIKMMKNRNKAEEIMLNTLKELSEIRKIYIESEDKLKTGVYTKDEMEEDIKCDLIIVYPDFSNEGLNKRINVYFNEEYKENLFEICNISNMLLDGYETVLKYE